MIKYFDFKNNKTKDPLKVSINLCWITLIICLVIKLIFPQIFLTICSNVETNIICNFINDNIIFKIIFIFIFNFILLTPYILSFYRLKWFPNKFQSYIFISFLILNSICKALLSVKCAFILELIIFVGYPTFYILYDCLNKNISKKQIVLNCLSPALYYIVFQLFLIVSFFIRNSEIHISRIDNIFLNFIYFFDVFIMVILYYLYKLKKR